MSKKLMPSVKTKCITSLKKLGKLCVPTSEWKQITILRTNIQYHLVNIIWEENEEGQKLLSQYTSSSTSGWPSNRKSTGKI